MAAQRRGVYRRAELGPLLAPRSIAVIGASPRAGAFGERTLRNLSGFRGRLFAVNPKYDRILDTECYASAGALPEPVDLAVIAAGREAVEPLLLDCAQAGVRAAIVFASGYAETGQRDGAAAQARLTAIAAETGIRIVGPNCIGVLNYAHEARVTFSAVPDQAAPKAPAIGLVSQSGALGFALSQSIERGLPLSHVLACGNSCDVDVADWIAALAEDPACSAIACVFEGMPDPTRLIEAAGIAWQADKPLIIHKLGTGEAGAAAALSHTGSLAGSDAAYRAAFDRGNMVQVDRFEAVLETASFLAKAPAPKAEGVAVIASSGGAAIMAADWAERHGVKLPQPGPAAQDVLSARIPEFGSSRNPCDVTAQIINDLGMLADCGGALLADPAYAALVYPYPYAYELGTRRIPWFSDMAVQHGKPVCGIWLPQWLEGPGMREWNAAPGLSLFHSMDSCMAAIRAWQDRGARRAAGDVAASQLSDAASAVVAQTLIAAAPAGTTIAEREAKTVLAAYGVPVVEEVLATSADEAATAAQRLGYPVVLKVESADIPHKTEADVIRLGLADDRAVRGAFDAVMANALRVTTPGRIAGVLVQPMVPAGLEVLVGTRVDPLLGPLVVVGLGGILAELMRDTVTALAPVAPREAEAMLRRLRGARLFNGFRGSVAIDVGRLACLVARVSELAADQRDLVAEMDVNPIICAGSRMIVVDALMVRRAPAPE